MSNTMGIDFAADQRETQADMPATLVWGDQSITCTRGDLSRSHDVDESGYETEIDGPVQAVLADFDNSTPPPIGTEITIDDIAVRVETSFVMQDGEIWHGNVTRV